MMPKMQYQEKSNVFHKINLRIIYTLLTSQWAKCCSQNLLYEKQNKQETMQ